jgi:hypothetical protein
LQELSAVDVSSHETFLGQGSERVGHPGFFQSIVSRDPVIWPWSGAWVDSAGPRCSRGPGRRVAYRLVKSPQ